MPLKGVKSGMTDWDAFGEILFFAIGLCLLSKD